MKTVFAILEDAVSPLSGHIVAMEGYSMQDILDVLVQQGFLVMEQISYSERKLYKFAVPDTIKE